MNDKKDSTSPLPWESVSKEDWQDWRWQLQHRVTTAEELQKHLKLHPDELSGVKVSKGKFAMSITPYWISLMDKEDPRCPIRRQVIPHIQETNTSKYELVDPCGEEKDSPFPGLVHRYPDRVLLIITDKCGSYCRFCTRKRIVSEEEDISIEKRLEQTIDYIKKNKQIRDVLISGGDPLILSDAKLEYILGALRSVPQIEILRIGTRIPITLPYRITDGLVKVLSKYHPLWMSLHINHPSELTPEVKEACNKLADKGIPLGSQSVLLRGVNDSVEVIRSLTQQLLTVRVRPYYLYQCDPVFGTEHFRTTVSKGIKIIKGLRGWTSGYAIPTYVIDAPGGGGKVPVSPDYVVKYGKANGSNKVVIQNYSGKTFEYIEPPIPLSSSGSKTKQKEEIVV
jgi:lysine 2,3-aminomutase